MTDERYDELVTEAMEHFMLYVLNYVEEHYPNEAKAFEAKMNEIAEQDLGEDFDTL
jgi:hypothetical protein